MDHDALESDEIRHRRLVDAVVDYAIYMLDIEGRVASWNQGAARIKGYNRKEVLGEHFSRFYTPEDRERGVPDMALETARREGRYESEGWRLRKDGSRFWAMVVIDAIKDDAGEVVGFAKITRDVTDRRDAQEKLQEAREQLFQAQKMEALGQLTGGLAHDFNNLLTAIMAGAELALRQADDNPRLTALLQSIRGAAERGGGLTRQLLAFARRQPLEPRTVMLGDQLPAVSSLLRHSLPAQIELTTEISDQVWPVEVDPSQLELSLLNLGFNARDAMGEGGRLRIAARNVQLSGEVDDLKGEFVAISVQDSGAGIPSDIRERIFEPFFTTKSFGQGTGLGLAQVYGFARQSGGAVVVESELGLGSTFTLYLPTSRRRSAHAADALEAALPNVLIVEDDLVVAQLAAELVRELGYSPRVVHSGAEALDALGAPTDMVFSDIVMPGGMSGLELAQRVRMRFPEMPIVLTTGYSEAVGGQVDFPVVQKPYQFEELSRTFEQALGRRPRTVPA